MPNPVTFTVRPHTPDAAYTVGDIVAKTGAKERSVLMWADALALWPNGGTNRAGRGVHRQFEWREVEVAAVLAAVAPFRLPIGVMVAVGSAVRIGLGLAEDPADPQFPVANDLANAIKSARRGEVGIDFVLIPNEAGAPEDDPFSLHVSFSDSGPRLHPRAALVVDIGECWKGLSR
jgi:hypothetical protein